MTGTDKVSYGNAHTFVIPTHIADLTDITSVDMAYALIKYIFHAHMEVHF